MTAHPQSAVTVVRGRRIITMTADVPEALAIQNGHIAAVGTVAALREQFPVAECIDAGGVICPGFNDAHAHLAMAAEDLLHLDLSIDSVRSLAEIKTLLRAALATTPAGGWIRGSRYDDAKMAEGRVLTRWDLDEIARDVPMLVIHVAGHWGVVNSKALALGGLDDRSDPPSGGALGRDANGRLNGILYEQAIFDYAYPSLARRPQTIAPASTFEDRLHGLQLALRKFHGAGITSVGDALCGPADIALFEEAQRRQSLTMRVNMLVPYQHYEVFRRLTLRTDFGGEHLRLGGVKAFVDGAIGGRTCLLEAPFEGTTDDYGIQTVSRAELSDIVRLVHGDGNRICVHANGDRAIALLLDQLEAAHAEAPQPQLHHRIEHCTVVTEDILSRMKRLHAVAVPFGSYVHYHGGKLLEWYGQARLQRMFAHRWFIDAGVAVAGSSDYPCGPFEPLLGMQSCVTRTGWDGTPLGTNQQITVAEALALYTTCGAGASGEAASKGKLTPGQVADFVVLDEDPFAVTPERLGTIGVLATYVGGQQVWPAPRAPAVARA